MKSLISFINNYLKENVPNFIYARTYQLIVTDNCNMRCKYCFEKFHTEDTNMDFNTAKKILDDIIRRETEINDGKCFRIHLFGGEPFLNLPLIKQLLEYIDTNFPQLNCVFSVATNGMVYNETVEELAKYKDKFNFAISLDGREEIHNINRGNYKQIIKNIEKLKKLGFPIQITSTFTVETIGYLFDSFYHAVHDIGIKKFKYILKLDDPAWNDENMVNVFNEQINKICDYLIENERYNEIKVANFNYNNFKSMRGNYICNNLNKNISYDYKGEGYNCFIFKNFNQGADYGLGNVNENIKDNSDKLVQLNDVNISPIYNECKDCPISAGCTRCPATILTQSANQVALCKMHKAELPVFERLLTSASERNKQKG